MLSREWRCSWSSADRRCSNYIRVIDNLSPTKVRLILEVLRYLAFEVRLRVRFHLRGAVTTARSGFLAYSVFMLCVSTTAGRRRDGGRCPRRVRRNGSWSHFSVPPWGAVAVLRQLVLRLLKYWSRDVDIKILRLLWNWTGDSAVVLLIRLSNIKMIGELYESPGFDISRNLSIRHLNSFLNRASTGRVVMLMKTEWELCSDMTIICLHYYKGRGFLYR